MRSYGEVGDRREQSFCPGEIPSQIGEKINRHRVKSQVLIPSLDNREVAQNLSSDDGLWGSKTILIFSLRVVMVSPTSTVSLLRRSRSLRMRGDLVRMDTGKLAFVNSFRHLLVT